MFKKIVIVSLALWLAGCTSMGSLQRGSASFKQGNYSEAFEQLKPLAEKDNADAQYAVGYMYYYGKGTSRDIVLAQKWIRAAAAQGQPQAIQAMAKLGSPAAQQNNFISYPDALNLR